MPADCGRGGEETEWAHNVQSELRVPADKRPIEKGACVGIVLTGIIFAMMQRGAATMMMKKPALPSQDIHPQHPQCSQEPTSLAI
jgi:hypothetical protein